MKHEQVRVNLEELCELFELNATNVVSIDTKVEAGSVIVFAEMRFATTKERKPVNELPTKCICGYQNKIERLEVIAKELYDALLQMKARRGIHVDDAEIVIGSIEKYEEENNG